MKFLEKRRFFIPFIRHQGVHSFYIIWFIKKSLHVLLFSSKNGWISIKRSQKSLFVVPLSLNSSKSIWRLLSTHHHGKYGFGAYPAGLTLTFLNLVLFFPVLNYSLQLKNWLLNTYLPLYFVNISLHNQALFSY